MIVPTIPNILQLGEIVQAQLAEIGITANITQVEPAQTADIFYAQQQGEGLVSPWGGRPDPTLTLQLQFGPDGFSNPGRHTTPAVEEAIAATKVVQSDEERTAALKAASAAVVADALDVVALLPDHAGRVHRPGARHPDVALRQAGVPLRRPEDSLTGRPAGRCAGPPGRSHPARP